LRARLQIPFVLPWRIALVAIALVSGLTWLVLAAGEMAGTTPNVATIRETLVTTLFGRAMAIRLLLLVALLILRDPRATALLAGIALALPALTSHAAATSPAGFSAIGITVDAMHLLSAGFWIGGLAALAALFARREPQIIAALGVFSHWAMVAVLLLVMTGLINATQILLGEKGADAPAYLWTLGAKLALVVAMLVLAMVNRFRLMPTRQTGQIARNAALELGIGLVVVLLAAWLGQMSPTL
jgi:putative copper resistance protein D